MSQNFCSMKTHVKRKRRCWWWNLSTFGDRKQEREIMGWLWLRARTQEGSACDRMLTLPLRVCGAALQLTAGKQINVCNGRGTWPDVAYYYHSYYLSIWLLSIFLGSLQIWSKTAPGIWTQMSIWQVRQLLNTKMLGKWVGTQRCHSLYLYFYTIHLFV